MKNKKGGEVIIGLRINGKIREKGGKITEKASIQRTPVLCPSNSYEFKVMGRGLVL